MLLSVVGVLFFYLVVSAICGLSLFMEGIHHRCANPWPSPSGHTNSTFELQSTSRGVDCG